jgi:hypothetical protein
VIGSADSLTLMPCDATDIRQQWTLVAPVSPPVIPPTLPPPSAMPSSCLLAPQVSGTYTINAAAPFQAICDQSDSGGWMKILSYSGPYYIPSSGAINTSTLFKLSDLQINALSTGDSVYKFVSPYSSIRLYLRTSAPYADTSAGLGLVNGVYSFCAAETFTSCTFNSSSLLSGPWPLRNIDSTEWGIVPDNDSRIFTDYRTSGPSCFVPDQAPHIGVRCFSTGYSGPNHPGIVPITPFSIFVRRT